MTTETRSYVRCPLPADQNLARLLNRGSLNVDLTKAIAGYAAIGETRTADQVVNNVRAALGMAGGGMLQGAVKSQVDGDVLRFRLIEGADIVIPDNLPGTVKAMIAKGNKFSPTFAGAIAKATGTKVEVNPQAKEFVKA